MKAALPDGEVSVGLMPIDRELELASITMSGQLDAIDMACLKGSSLKKFAAIGWLEPLDLCWESRGCGARS